MLLIPALALQAQSGEAPPLEIEAPIEEVVVHVDGALVTHRANIDLPEGRSTLRFDLFEMPDTLDGLTILSTATRRGTQVLSTRLDEVSREPDPDRIRELRNVVFYLESELGSSLRTVRNTQADLELLERIADEMFEQVSDAPASAEQDRLLLEARLEFTSQRRLELFEQLITAEREVQDLEKRAERAHAKLIENDRPHRMACVLIEVDSPGGEDRLELTWLERRSSWTSELTLRTSSETGEASIEVHAVVDNETHADWSDVELGLSTGRVTGLTPPDVMPVWIDLDEDEDQDQEAEAPAMTEAPPRSDSDDGILLVQQVEKPATLKRGRGRILVKRFLTQSTLTAISRPVIGPETWIRGTVKNAGKTPLLPGPVTIYLDDTFVGMPELDTHVPAGGMLPLWLGEHDALEIERTVLDRETVKTGLLGGGRLTRTRFQITVRNRGDRKIDVVIEDRIPEPRSEDIEVEVKDVSPPLLEDDGSSRPGLLRWKIEVPADSEGNTPTEVVIEWTTEVSHSADVETTPIPE
jgi:hypothetical protein